MMFILNCGQMFKLERITLEFCYLFPLSILLKLQTKKVNIGTNFWCLLALCQAQILADAWEYTSDDQFLHSLPLHHIHKCALFLL